MYTSAKSGNRLLRHCIGCMAAAVFLAVFGAVYEHFSHEVYSYYMIYAFLIPLVLGALPYGLMALKNVAPKRGALHLWDSAIAAFSVGSLFQGVLDIYGTTNRLIIVYPLVGIALGLSALVCLVLQYLDTSAPGE